MTECETIYDGCNVPHDCGMRHTGYDIKYQQVIHVNIEDKTYKLNFVGQVVHFEGGVSSEAIYIHNIPIYFTTGTTEQTIDVSDYVDSDKSYFPILTAQDEVTKHLSSRCDYLPNKTVKIYVDSTATTGEGSYGNTLALIPVHSQTTTIEGITNGQRYGTDAIYYTKTETDTLLGDKQDTLVSGTNIKTINGNSLLGSGDITIDSSNGIIAIHEFYMDEAVPTESTGLKTIVHNMASYVEDGVEYMPMFIARTHFEKMSRTIQYDSSTKYIRIYYYHTYGEQDRMYGTLYLVPVDRQGSDSGTLKGLTNGLLMVDESDWSTQYLQTTESLVTSVSSSSTDEEYPSAKLFYDTCGDIETLINAL